MTKAAFDKIAEGLNEARVMVANTAPAWPDDARELLEWALAIHFSGDRMPHMSGDPRNRLSPGRRRAMEDARDAALDALAPVVAALVEAARREERERIIARAKGYMSSARHFGDQLATETARSTDGTP